VGSVTFPQATIVSKIVQNMRYLNLTVTDDLSEIFQTWSTDLIPWNIPDFLSGLDHFRQAPGLFSQYSLDSPFLTNFWSTLMTLGVSIGVLIGCFLLRMFIDRTHYNKSWVNKILQKLVLGSFNFALVQVYGCLDDIVFYLVLDIKGNPFNSVYSWASILCASAFMAAGGFLVYFNFRVVQNYQRVKAEKDMSTLEGFNEKNKYWELFYADFNDADMWSQSTLALIVVRSGLSSFIIAVLYDYPLMQTLFMLVLDGTMILFLMKKNPFTTLRGKLTQYYFETITLFVHLSAFVLSFQEDGGKFSETLLTTLCTGIIYLNMGLMIGSVGFMFIELYKTISEYLKSRYRKYETIAIQTDTYDDDTQIINLVASAGTQNQEKKNWTQNAHVAPIENSYLLPEQSQRSFTGVNLLPTNNFSMIAEDSVIQDVDIINSREGGSATPIIIRNRRINIKKRPTNGSALEKQPKMAED